VAAAPFLTPWAAPLATPSSASPDALYLAPTTIGGLPYLAPEHVPSLTAAPVMASGEIAYFAPPLVDDRFFLAPRLVPVTLILPSPVYGGGKKSPPKPERDGYDRRHSYEQEDAAAAAEFDDEEIVLTFLMELALHV